MGHQLVVALLHLIDDSVGLDLLGPVGPVDLLLGDGIVGPVVVVDKRGEGSAGGLSFGGGGLIGDDSGPVLDSGGVTDWRVSMGRRGFRVPAVENFLMREVVRLPSMCICPCLFLYWVFAS